MISLFTLLSLIIFFLIFPSPHSTATLTPSDQWLLQQQHNSYFSALRSSNSSTPFPSSFLRPVAYSTSPACAPALTQWESGPPYNVYPQENYMVYASGHSLNDIGSYDTCLYIEYNSSVPLAHPCTAVLNFAPTYIYYVGLCLPIECSSADIQSNWQSFFAPALSTFAFPPSLPRTIAAVTVYCPDEQSTFLTNNDAFPFFIILIILGFLLAICTVLDWCLQNMEAVEREEEEPAAPVRTVYESPIRYNIPAVDGRSPKSSSRTSSSLSASSTPTFYGSNSERGRDSRLEQIQLAEQRELRAREKRERIDAGEEEPPPFFTSFVQAFSVTHNLEQLLLPSYSGALSLAPIHGIRVLTLFWLILAHTLVYSLPFTVNLDYLLQVVSHRVSFNIILSATYTTDTFFLLSGFLSAYFLIFELDSTEGEINYLSWVIHRYIRLTPSMMFWLAFSFLLAPYLIAGLGPFTAFYPLDTAPVLKGCNDYWWAHLLYIFNFYPTEYDNQCMNWVWYVGNDFIFTLIAPLYALAWYHQRIVGWLLVGFTLFITYLITGLLVGLNGYKALFYPTPNSTITGVNDLINTNSDYYMQIFQRPYCRIAPYIVGIILAFLIKCQEDGETEEGAIDAEGGSNIIKSGKERRKNILHISRVKVLPVYFLYPGYVISILVMIIIIFLIYTFNGTNSDGTINWPSSFNLIYITFSRTIWSIAVAFIIYNLLSTPTGLLYDFLSWSVWIPLSKLSYQLYLLHPILLQILTYVSVVPYTYSDSGLFIEWIAVIGIGYIIALVGWLLVEKPLTNLENAFISNRRERIRERKRKMA